LRLVVKKQNIRLVLTMQERAKLFANGRWRTEAFRGVVDAGRRTKTQVQRSAFKQMAMLKYGFVAQNTRGTPRQAKLAYEIYALKGGQRIEEYAGLRALATRGKTARRFNVDRDVSDKGFVRSGVWNKPRTFKRSFATNGGFFAMLPGGTRTTAPKSMWTYGSKPDQPRDPLGRFASPGRKYGKIRRLYGGALRKEIGKDQALATFHRVGPAMLEQKVTKRLARFLKF
jgi:hypothetical protein